MKKQCKGFTLAELLIVVAIIAVLVAVAIPTFNSQLEKSRQSTDLSNLREAYAAAKIAEMTGEVSYPGDASKKPFKVGSAVGILQNYFADGGVLENYNGIGNIFWYDADKGQLYPDTSSNAANASNTASKAGTTFTYNGADGAECPLNTATTLIKELKTTLNAHSTRRVVDTTSLPGNGVGIIQYFDSTDYNANKTVLKNNTIKNVTTGNATTQGTSPLVGSESAKWPSTAIMVEFTNNNGIWELKPGGVRFVYDESIKTALGN